MKVITRNANRTARNVPSQIPKRLERTFSPIAPIARDVSVTPSCIAAMKCGGSLVILITDRALRLPSSESSFSRVRRTVTSEYSAATKKPFRRISPATTASSRNTVMPRAPERRYERVSRPLLRGSIGDGGDVSDACDMAFGSPIDHEALEVREGLGDRESSRRRVELSAEEWKRHLIR